MVKNKKLKKYIFEELLKDTRLTKEQKKIIEFDPRISQIIDIIYEKIKDKILKQKGV